MTLLNDTIADISLEKDEVEKLLETVLLLKVGVETYKERYDPEEYEELMWDYDHAVDDIKDAIASLNEAWSHLMNC